MIQKNNIKEHKPDIDDVWQSLEHRNIDKIHVTKIEGRVIHFIALDLNGNTFYGYENRCDIMNYYRFLYRSNLNIHQLF